MPVVESMIRPDGDKARFVVWDLRTGEPVPAKTQGVEPALEGAFEITLSDGARRTVRPAWSILLERISLFSPEIASEITGVDADKIRKSAIVYAESSPGACVNFMQGIEEHLNNTSAMRDILCLMAITGNLDVKGGNVRIPFWNEMLGPRLTGDDPPAQMEKKLGNTRCYPVSQPSAVWKAILTEDPYPIKAFIVFAGNPLSWCEDPKYVEEALRKVEFLVAREYFMSPTAELADIVLPSAHWLERDYIADELTGRYYFGQQRAIDPLYERKSCITLMRELGRMVAPDWWPWETDEELFDFQLETVGITWKELQNRWVYKYAPETYRFYEKNWFETPSGLVEIYSNVLASVGGDPLPSYVPAVEPTDEYPFIIMTGRRYPNYYHSTFLNISWLRSLEPHPKVDINPQAAQKLGINDGDLVWIESHAGKIQMFARLTNGIHPRNLSATHGWRMGCRELGLPGYPNHIANVNALINSDAISPEFATPNLRCLPVKIYKAERSEIPGFPCLNLREVQS
jgi:anaerobic selenocysteine-containing dehydrogenase